TYTPPAAARADRRNPPAAEHPCPRHLRRAADSDSNDSRRLGSRFAVRLATDPTRTSDFPSAPPLGDFRMLLRRPLYGVTVGLCLVLPPALRADAQVRSQNFVVTAPDQQTAQQFAQMAEHYRKQKAMDWLGQEMPPWPHPCPLFVKPTMGGAGGATKFNYDFRGNYEVLSMEINGEYSKMLHSVLPHEVTHTVFAHHFRYPV